MLKWWSLSTFKHPQHSSTIVQDGDQILACGWSLAHWPRRCSGRAAAGVAAGHRKNMMNDAGCLKIFGPPPKESLIHHHYPFEVAITRSIDIHWHGLIIRIGDQDVHKMLVNCQKMAQTGLNVAKWQESTGARFFFFSPTGPSLPGVGRLQCLRRAGRCTTSRSGRTRVRHPMGSGILESSRGECWKLLISSCRKLGILIFSHISSYFYTLMLSLKHFWTIFFHQKIGKRWDGGHISGQGGGCGSRSIGSTFETPSCLASSRRPWHLLRFGGSTIW